MSRIREFKLPDLGEGLTEGEILKWLVQPGDTVRVNDPIVEVETAKAAVEVPSPYAGVVTELFHPEGTTVDVGTPIIAFDTEPGAGPTPAETEIEEGKIGGKTASGRTAVLVGYGVKETTAVRRPRKAPARVSAATVADAAATRPKATPPVRKRAKDLGIDLTVVPGTGPQGSITRSDLEALTAAPRATMAAGREERIPIKGVRKLTAANVSASAREKPHVTEFLTVDVTPMMELRSRLAALPDFAGVKVSPLALVARALVLAVRRHPEINATWDEAAQEIVVRHYVNLGIAAATPRGLLVPNVKDADALSLPALARALADLAATAKDGKTQPADMQGGTITITNVGVFGVDNGTPIINGDEAAILCFGVVRELPWVHEGQIAIRQVTQLSLSFDHRLVDGELGSRFLADLGTMLADPAAMLAWS